MGPLRKRLISPTHLVALLALGAVVIALSVWKTPEGQLRAALIQGATDLSYRQSESEATQRARFQASLTALLTPNARVQVQGQTFSGVEGALQGLTQLRQTKPTLLLELAELNLAKQGEALTGVALLNLSETQVGDLHREQRRLDLVFSWDGEAWRLSQLRVGEADNDEPWERP